ncbi:MAG: HAMP domain-containing histidine kinase [Phycisphaeraceae bacterium]|nr:HAMP domain-containing histidine kinase [Phycisphaeraceae bacterium]
MTIHRKFAILLGLFGVAVAMSLATSLWSFRILEQEISAPFERMTTALRGLGKTKRVIEAQATVLLGPRAGPREMADGAQIQGVRGARSEDAPAPDGQSLKAFESLAETADTQLQSLESDDSWTITAGTTAAQNLRKRIGEARASGLAWLQDRNETARVSGGEQLFELHELIELMEGRILEDARLAVEFKDRLRGRLLLALALALGLSVLTGGLSVVLVRRWVSRPVARLRTAAERIASGDFEYRLPVDGGDELSQLSSEVNHMAGMVARMQRERIEQERLAAMGQMVRRLAHNIRNPLSGIRGLAELTRSEPGLDEDSRSNQQRIIDAVDRFEAWLAELLRTTNPTNLDPTPTAVRPWLQSVVQAHDPMARTRGIGIVLDDADAPETAYFDSTHLGHAVAALLANAIDASPPAGSVHLRAGSLDGHWSIQVQDSGSGIPSENRQKVFQPHFTTKKGGTGIGLAVAQQVVRAHGGRIEIHGGPLFGTTPQESVGAVFTITLPLTSPTPAGTDTANSGQQGDRSGQNPGH